MCDAGPYSPIYRPDHFYGLPIGGIVMLVNTSGPVLGLDANETPFFHIDYMEQVSGLTQHGAVVIWTHSAAAPAGYALDANAASGVINAGASINVTPNVFNLAHAELLQFRMKLRPIIWAGAAVDDIDLLVSLPGAVSRWTTLNARGRVNMARQSALPGDTGKGPIQGANIAAAQLQPVIAPWDSEPNTEMFSFEQTGPTYTILNNGSTNSAANDAIAIEVWGYDYKLSPAKNDGTWRPRQWPGKPGELYRTPEHYTVVPIGGRGK